MKFSDIVRITHWTEVAEILVQKYPDQKENASHYSLIFNELMSLNPTNTPMTILVEEFDDDGIKYTHVHGYEGNRADGEIRGLGFVPWEEWLEMEIDGKSLQEYSNAELIAHCLWEMTFYGFTQTTIRDFVEDLDKSRADDTYYTHEEMRSLLGLEEENPNEDAS